MSTEQPKEMTVAEAGRKGGRIVKERYRKDFLRGNRPQGRQYDQEEVWGRPLRLDWPRGGRTTADRHGQEFYEEIGRKGGQRVRELIERGKQGG